MSPVFVVGEVVPTSRVRALACESPPRDKLPGRWHDSTSVTISNTTLPYDHDARGAVRDFATDGDCDGSGNCQINHGVGEFLTSLELMIRIEKHRRCIDGSD